MGRRKPTKRRKRRGKKITGNARAMMYLARDIRRRWYQFGVNRKEAARFTTCQLCGDEPSREIDHIDAVGPYPRAFQDVPEYLSRMFLGKCQALCIRCHLVKSASDRLKMKPGSPKQKESLNEGT